MDTGRPRMKYRKRTRYYKRIRCCMCQQLKPVLPRLSICTDCIEQTMSKILADMDYERWIMVHLK